MLCFLSQLHSIYTVYAVLSQVYQATAVIFQVYQAPAEICPTILQCACCAFCKVYLAPAVFSARLPSTCCVCPSLPSTCCAFSHNFTKQVPCVPKFTKHLLYVQALAMFCKCACVLVFASTLTCFEMCLHIQGCSMIF